MFLSGILFSDHCHNETAASSPHCLVMRTSKRVRVECGKLLNYPSLKGVKKPLLLLSAFNKPQWGPLSPSGNVFSSLPNFLQVHTDSSARTSRRITEERLKKCRPLSLQLSSRVGKTRKIRFKGHFGEINPHRWCLTVFGTSLHLHLVLSEWKRNIMQRVQHSGGSVLVLEVLQDRDDVALLRGTLILLRARKLLRSKSGLLSVTWGWRSVMCFCSKTLK